MFYPEDEGVFDFITYAFQYYLVIEIYGVLPIETCLIEDELCIKLVICQKLVDG